MDLLRPFDIDYFSFSFRYETLYDLNLIYVKGQTFCLKERNSFEYYSIMHQKYLLKIIVFLA